MNLLKKAEKINLNEYRYNLPEDRIAKHPLEKRDHSKLLHFSKGEIADYRFFQLADILPSNSLLVFNDTKVIPARVNFKKQTGASIELFLLSPIAPTPEVSEAMLVKSSCSWKCMIGNRKRWKKDDLLERYFKTEQGKLKVTAQYDDYENNIIQFSWENAQIPFVEVIELMGTTPLPPYLNRTATEKDKPRYQTVYSKNEGAVAAPTAGLHFTEDVLGDVQKKNTLAELTLHVGAGTFQPIKSDNVLEHDMHCEQISVTKEVIEKIVRQSDSIVAVGTTSVRTLESLFWYGHQLLNGTDSSRIQIEKLYPYQSNFENLPSRKQAFEAILHKMNKEEVNALHGDTEIFIFPDYKFQVVDALITNFHQPESTLILLIAAFLGEDWRNVYQHALDNQYRFLSYGDSSLLIP